MNRNLATTANRKSVVPGLIRRARGFSLFELFVVLAAAAIIGFFFLDRVLFYQEMAEKTAAELTIINLRTSLRYRVADLLIHNKGNEIAGLVGANPITWLKAPPPNYIGEIGQPRGDRIPPGSWYFDLGKKELVYRVKNAKHFMIPRGGQPQFRFRVTALQKPSPVDGRAPIVEGLSLILIEQYMWF